MKKLFLAFSVLIGCGGPSKIELQGGGATFPYPLYSKMFDVYHKQFNVKINYQSIGSGGGQRQLINKTIDFGGSDAFMTDSEMKGIKEIFHIPICLGAVVITYNLPNNPKIKLTGDIISDIFFGKITRWNDERIQGLNPDITLPNKEIIVVRRSDASGTTFIFTDYLSKISKEWEKNIGRGTSVNWKKGLGGKGNAGVVSLIKQIPYSLSYVELTYALEQNLPATIIKNKNGNFIEPTLSSVSIAGEGEIPDDTRVSITDTIAELGYPISGFTWILVYKEQGDKEKGKELVRLLDWMIDEGQKYTTPFNYAPLSENVLKKARVIIKSITYNGKPLFKERNNLS